MSDTNYISSTVKIVETPKQTFFKNIILLTEFQVLLPQVRNNIIIYLNFWGNLGQDIANYYQINDYIVVEGYLSFKNGKKTKITVLKVYPFFLS